MSASPAPGGAPHATGPWTRASLSLQVAGVVLLAAAAAALVTWLAGRPGLRLRWDMTAEKRNTLDPALEELVRKLPEQATIEFFFRPLDPPFDQVGGEIQQRMRELVFVAKNQLSDKLFVVDHDLTDLAAAGQRLRELQVFEDNVVVVHMGSRQAVLRLFSDLARIDVGNPSQQIPPRLEAFRGDEALGKALLRVSAGRAPKIVFSSGHGERELSGVGPGDLGALQTLLRSDGFEPVRWDPARESELPEDADVLAIVDPRQPFAEREIESVRRFLGRGGRLLVTPSSTDAALDGPGSMAQLLREHGIQTQAGFVARLVPNPLGQMIDGVEECAALAIGPDGMDRHHPVTESLVRGRTRVLLVHSRSFARGTAPAGEAVLDLLRSTADCWRDLPDESGRYDWRRTRLEGDAGPFVLCMAASFAASARDTADASVGDSGADRSSSGGRVLALGSADALGNGPFQTNRDLALNMFNWLAARESRLVLRPRTEERRVVDVQNTNALAVLHRVSSLALPGLFALLGLAVAWRRRK